MEVLPSADASKVHVVGEGVNPNIPASVPVSFTIDAREAGVADLEVAIRVNSNSFPVICMIKNEIHGTSYRSLLFCNFPPICFLL